MNDWFKRIFFPFFFMILLLCFLAFSLFKGQEHRSLIAEIEERWIDASLFLAGQRIPKLRNNQIFLSLGYLSEEWKWAVLKKIYEKNPKFVFLFYLDFFLKNEESKSFFKGVSSKTKTVFTLDPSRNRLLEESLKNSKILILENDTCELTHQRICVYNEARKNWIGKYLLDSFCKEKEFSFLSQGLYRILPSFLVYLAPSQNVFYIEEENEVDILLSNSFLEDKIVFVDFLLKKENKREEEKITHLFSNKHYSRSLFWYDFLQQISDHDFISIASNQTRSLFWIFSLSLMSLFLFSFDFFGLFCFTLMLMLFVLFFNAFFVFFFRVYIPVAALSFFLFSLALVGGFLKLSYASYCREIDLLREKENQDLKNFRRMVISIISHNVNTPLAQIQGLLDLVKSELNEVSVIKKSLGEAYLNVKLFLTIISIQSKRISKSSVTFKEFVHFFRKESKLCLENMGVKINLFYDRMLISHIFHGSSAVVSYVVFCFSYFFAKRKETVELDLLISCEAKTDYKYILLEILSDTPIHESYFFFEHKKTIAQKSLDEVIVKFFDVIKDLVEVQFFYREKENAKFSISVCISFRKFFV